MTISAVMLGILMNRAKEENKKDGGREDHGGKLCKSNQPDGRKSD